MSLARRIAENTAVQFAGKILSILLGLATFAVIQRALHPSGFGEYTMVISYLGFFSVIADLGLYVILVREMNKPGVDRDRVFANVLGIRLVSVAFIFLVALALLPFFGYPQSVDRGVFIGIAAFISVAVTQLLISVFQSTLTMGRVALAELFGRTVLLIGSVLALQGGFGLGSIILATVVANAVNCLLLMGLARRQVRIRVAFDRPIWGYLLRETAPVAASVTLNLIYFRMDTIILSLYRAPSEVGLYGAAYKILETLNTFPIMFVGLMLPLLTRAFAENRQRFQQLYQQAFSALFMSVLPLIVGGWFLAEPIISFISGEEYVGAAPVLRLLLVAVGFLFLNSLSGHTVTVINKQRKMVWGYLGVAVFGLVIYLSLIPWIGMRGAAIGTIITEGLSALIGSIMVFRTLRFHVTLAAAGKAVIASAVMGLVLWLIPGQRLFVELGAGVAVYVAILALIRGIPPSLIRLLVQPDAPRSAGDDL